MKKKDIKKMKKNFTLMISMISGIIAVLAVMVEIFDQSQEIKNLAHIIFYVSIILVIIFMGFFVYIEISNMDEKIDSFEKSVEKFQELCDTIENDLQVIGNCSVQDDANKKNLCPIQESSYVEDSVRVGNELCDIIDKGKKLKELHIICFGRNGFGGVIEYIVNKKINIAVKVIVFNADANPDICHVDDKSRIERNIIEWLKDSSNIEVIVSNIPPMIRAAVVYAENEKGRPYAIWGSMQSYRFAYYNDVQRKISLERPKNSLVSVCRAEKTVERDFRTLVKCFEEEYSRLKSDSRKAVVTKNVKGEDCVTYVNGE